jgi:membrane-associated protein
MDLFSQFWSWGIDLLDLVLRLDRHLAELIAQYGIWTYAILFAVIFCETGLIVTPFLPGDSLLFITGALVAKGGLNVHLMAGLLIIAAILGDAVNYAVGRYFGPRVFRKRESRWLNPEHLERAHAFYERHGGITIILARFIPIIRTYVPFVAGMARMSYPQFALYNVAGALIWVASLIYAGYFFGNIPWVKANLTVIIFAIIGVSVLPLLWTWVQSRLAVWRARSPSPR